MALWLALSLTTALAAAPPSPRPSTAPEDSSAPAHAKRRKTRTPGLDQDAARGFVVAGAILTAASTWTSGMIASRFLDSSNPTKQAMGRVLPISFAGPIAAAAMGEATHQPLGMLGVLQGSGLSFLAVGAVSMARHRRLGHDRPRSNRSHSTGVLALTQGVMWFSITWGMTFGFSRPGAREGEEFDRRLQVPIVGGIWAAPQAPNYTRGYLGLTSSAIQIASASAVVFGAVVLGKHRKRSRLSLMPLPTPEGAQLVAAMRF